MKIKVKLYGHLQRYATRTADPLEIEVPSPATVNDVCRALGMPATERKVVFVDECLANGHTRLKKDSVMVFFAPVEGG